MRWLIQLSTRTGNRDKQPGSVQIHKVSVPHVKPQLVAFTITNPELEISEITVNTLVKKKNTKV